MSEPTEDALQRSIDLTLFELLAASRRTSLRVDPDRPVPIEVIERLARLAMWAPNHKKTWPWRFAVFTGAGRAALGRTIADALTADGSHDDARIEKFRVKYLRAPALLVVGSAGDETELRHVENRDAVAAGVQNLLLGATAAGLASFWSSAPPAAAHVALRDLCSFGRTDQIVAMIYLGWPVAAVAAPERPQPEVRRVDR